MHLHYTCRVSLYEHGPIAWDFRYFILACTHLYYMLSLVTWTLKYVQCVPMNAHMNIAKLSCSSCHVRMWWFKRSQSSKMGSENKSLQGELSGEKKPDAQSYMYTKTTCCITDLHRLTQAWSVLQKRKVIWEVRILLTVNYSVCVCVLHIWFIYSNTSEAFFFSFCSLANTINYKRDIYSWTWIA